MVFSSSIFLFLFLPLLLMLYYILPSKFRNAVLLVASLAFYAWGEPVNVFIMLLSILVNYGIGLAINNFQNKQDVQLVSIKYDFGKLYLVISILYNIGVLFWFKYLNFSVGIVEALTKTDFGIREIALPIGISFYTFQIMSYVIDVYNGKVKAQKNLWKLALYVSLFPQLIAGPIVRYIDVEKQISDREYSLEGFALGTKRFMLGFSKKILLADQLAPLADVAFSSENVSSLLNWVGIVAYTLQIYYDFSGYSDMAIGLGKMFGFDFLENFNYPYISRSIQEFWRRWHISLSSWFRDYLYIPLGGRRKGTTRTYINLIIVFFVTGLWHGASFNFIVWGLFYVVFLIIERLGFNKILEKLPRILRHLYSILIIMFGWIFFRADTLRDAILYMKGLFVVTEQNVVRFQYEMNLQLWFCLIIGVLLTIPLEDFLVPIKDLTNNRKINKKVLVNIKGKLEATFIFVVFIIAICYMVGSGYSPFLYFRF